MLPEGREDKRTPDSDLVKAYKDIFIKVKKWGSFEISDIELNGVRNVTREPQTLSKKSSNKR